MPVYAEMGRAGGFRLVEGYFLPPVMFSVRAAISLVLGLSVLRNLRASPFAAERETGAQKLLAAMPDHLRAVLAEAQKVIGFERTAGDAFHAAPADARWRNDSEIAELAERTVVDVFLQAILEHQAVVLDYRSPYRAGRSKSGLRRVGCCGIAICGIWLGSVPSGVLCSSGAQIAYWKFDQAACRPAATPSSMCVRCSTAAGSRRRWSSGGKKRRWLSDWRVRRRSG